MSLIKSSSSSQAYNHEPVMLNEVMAALAPKHDDVMIDMTFGRGGYSQALLKTDLKKLIAYDRDPEAALVANGLQKTFLKRFEFKSLPFSSLQEAKTPINGIVFDLGLSSPQIDNEDRGFSFQYDGPLDMRMGSQKASAADVVNDLPEAVLADIFYYLGEEKRSRVLARHIIAKRKEKRFESTRELASLIESVIPKTGRIHPATRSFQALRIFVNDELNELATALNACGALLVASGRLVVVSFHSLEDRIVKYFLRETEALLDRDPITHAPLSQATFKAKPRGTVLPSREETQRNPRARSARLRAALRTDAPFKAIMFHEPWCDLSIKRWFPC